MKFAIFPRLPANIPIPSASRIRVIIILKIKLSFDVLRARFEIFVASSAIATKVMAIPREYAPNRVSPWIKLVSASARVKMLPRIGP